MRGNQEQGYHNQHLYVRFVRTYDLAVADPIFERFTVQLPLQTTSNADPFRLWGKVHPPRDPQCQIPVKCNWAHSSLENSLMPIVLHEPKNSLGLKHGSVYRVRIFNRTRSCTLYLLNALKQLLTT
jgi:hypothetical protein